MAGNSITTTNADENNPLTFNTETYTISYNANGGSGAPSSQTKNYGVDIQLSSTIPTRNGYEFLGWSEDSTATSAKYAAGATYSSNSGVTLYAVWKVATCTVTYNANGGTCSKTSDTVIIGGTIDSLPIPTRYKYNFNGWFTANSGGTQVTESTIINGSMTLYAQWSEMTTQDIVNNYAVESGSINGPYGIPNPGYYVGAYVSKEFEPGTYAIKNNYESATRKILLFRI